MKRINKNLITGCFKNLILKKRKKNNFLMNKTFNCALLIQSIDLQIFHLILRFLIWYIYLIFDLH